MNLYCLLCYLFIGFNNNYMSSLDRLNHYTTDEKKDKKVNLNDLLERLEIEKKKEKKKNLALTTAAISAIAVFGVILTL